MTWSSWTDCPKREAALPGGLEFVGPAGHDGGMTKNLLASPDPTLLPFDHPDMAAADALAAGQAPEVVAQNSPASSLAWAVLAERALKEGDGVTAYAFARTGYHRGLDALRRAGWRGHGPIPVDHEPNQGFLRALLSLAEAADAIGEDDEAERCFKFLDDSVAPATSEDVSALR